MKKITITTTAVIIISYAIALYLWPQMPDSMAAHWNMQGEVDGYMSKFWGLFLMPIISTIVFALFIFTPKIDPLKKNIEKFRKHYDRFMLLLIAFLLYIYLVSLAWNLEYKIDIGGAIMPAMGILIYYTGVLIQNSKRNWMIGIRTPWTLSNDKVWEKTHRFGAKLFKIAGILTILSTAFKLYAFWIVIIAILTAALSPIVYSYFEYRKTK